MSRYLVQIPRDTLSAERKAGIAKAITRVHSDVTGDAADTVQVVITEIDAGCFFSGGSLIECGHIFVHGFMRDEHQLSTVKDTLSSRLASETTLAADFEPDATWVTLTGAPDLSS
ncbi:phenylpyruvate tautomerase PptA (4-oxalocrotonate tautomerase family) [Nitrobacteraceae bacterium AZCC 1564]